MYWVVLQCKSGKFAKLSLYSNQITKTMFLRKLTLLLFFVGCFITQHTAQTSYQTLTKKSADGRYTWQEVVGDPTGTRHYTLGNGLTVIITENRLEPRIMTLFTTKAGSKHDPADNTGLAHYLEHMLFKGTDRFGSLDYEKERVELDRIEALYERYNQTSNQQDRKEIYRQIDSVSGVAARYAIANEYDKMMAAIGSNMTNAFTSFENTTYMESVPSNNLERFLMIQQERFRNPVLRLFHTELEAVYEEKNISLDNGNSKVFEAIFSGLFKRHPYGTQTTIGTIEHLKNPSLKAIREYYYRYYVPDNMALILTGDLDADEAIRLVDQYLGAWASKPVPPFTFEKEQPRAGVEEVTVLSPDEESVAIGYVMPNALSKESVIADLVSAILYNGKSGLIDKNLVKQQRVLDAYGFNYLLQDYGIFYLGGRPLEGQGLQALTELILAEIDNLKRGNFEEDLIAATVNNLKVSRLQEQESAVNMAYVLNDQFVVGKSWQQYLEGVEAMSRITKKDVVQFANQWFKDDYIVVYKLSGQDAGVEKVEKPEISPVEVNRDSQSEFLKTIVQATTTAIAPVFVDYNKDIQRTTLRKGLPVWSVQNRINDLFSLYYVLDMGENHMKKLPLAIEYLKLIGTSAQRNEEINSQFYQLAVDFNIFGSRDQVFVSLSGLQENFEAAVRLLESLLTDPKADEAALDKMIAAKIKSRNDALLNKNMVFRGALQAYAAYGPVNPFNDVLSNEELRAITAQELIDIIKSLTGYKHRVMYYGPETGGDIAVQLKKLHKTPSKLMDYPAEKRYEPLPSKENVIYYVDYDMVQAEIGLQRWDEPFDAKLLPMVSAFNEYYGGGMGSVVFQEIRESKALAYAASSSFARPGKKDMPFSASFYVGTQADKLPDAMAAVKELLDEMPESPKMWSVGQQAIRQGIETNRITKANILFNYQNALRLGLDYDVRRDIYEAVEGITLEDIRKFHADGFAGKPWTMRLIGSRSKLDLEALRPYGRVVELSLKDIFGYEPASLKP
jgi:predicted Zn-dependent peptidase